MKNFLLTLGAAVLACVAAFVVFYLSNHNTAIHAAAREGDAMAWLRAEFRLDETQYAAIKRVHDEYSVECGVHCTAIIAAKERRAKETEIAALEKTCVDAMTTHFRRVAGLMPPRQGERYLAMVLPRIQGYSHQAPPNVRALP